MNMYADGCAGCAISQGLRQVPGGVVKLFGNWTVNHYNGDEGYLGWLALQPRFHRMALRELTESELQSLGPNIRDLDIFLTRYWDLQYPDDPILRVYVVYFFESAFQRPPEKEPFHLHIHVIPRFRSLDSEGCLQRTENEITWVDGWAVPSLAPRQAVSEPYKRDLPGWRERASGLMGYLRQELSARP